MTRDELIAAVPVHWHAGRPYFVRLDEIPEPFRQQVLEAVIGCACPTFLGEGQLYYAWDWSEWVNGRWYGRGPVGLDETN